MFLESRPNFLPATSVVQLGRPVSARAGIARDRVEVAPARSPSPRYPPARRALSGESLGQLLRRQRQRHAPRGDPPPAPGRSGRSRRVAVRPRGSAVSTRCTAGRARALLDHDRVSGCGRGRERTRSGPASADARSAPPSRSRNAIGTLAAAPPAGGASTIDLRTAAAERPGRRPSIRPNSSRTRCTTTLTAMRDPRPVRPRRRRPAQIKRSSQALLSGWPRASGPAGRPPHAAGRRRP